MRKTTLLTTLATMALAMLSPVQAAAQSDTLKFTGTFTDQKGRPMRGVVVSNGFTCVQTDTKGNYELPYNSATKFVYFTVPADCEVPTHSATDNTSCCYRQVVDSVKRYDFQLTRMPRGKEKSYKLIVIGDPQVTNAYGPYFQGPNDNAVRKSDIDRFTDETMADIK